MGVRRVSGIQSGPVHCWQDKERRETSGVGRLTATSLSSRPMRRRAGSIAFGRLVAAMTLRWHPCPVGSKQNLQGTGCTPRRKACRAQLEVTVHKPHTYFFKRVMTTLCLSLYLWAPDCVAAPSNSVSSWATIRASCGCWALRTGANESSSSRKMTTGCCLFACSRASSNASRRRFSDSPVVTDHFRVVTSDYRAPTGVLQKTTISQLKGAWIFSPV